MADKQFTTPDGEVEYHWITPEEATQNYSGFETEKPVLLDLIQADETGKGQGSKLLDSFIAEMKKQGADLIYAWVQWNPFYYEDGEEAFEALSEDQQNKIHLEELDKLLKFYGKHGFWEVPGITKYPGAMIDMYLELDNKSESATPVKDKIEDPTETFYKALGPHRMAPASEADMEEENKGWEQGEAGDEGYKVWLKDAAPEYKWKYFIMHDENGENFMSGIEDENEEPVLIAGQGMNSFDEAAALLTVEFLESVKMSHGDAYAATNSNQGLHYSDPMVYQAALEVIDGTETDEELEALAEMVMAKTLNHKVDHIEGDDENEEEMDIFVEVSIQPADREVGISEPYVEEVYITKIVPAGASDRAGVELVGEELKRISDRLENDKSWVQEVGHEAMQEAAEKEQEDYEYAQEQKYQQMKDDRLTGD